MRLFHGIVGGVSLVAHDGRMQTVPCVYWVRGERRSWEEIAEVAAPSEKLYVSSRDAVGKGAGHFHGIGP